MDKNIKDKVVAITGASSGIGEATALNLARKGAKVVLGARREEHLKEIVNRIKNQGGKAVYAVTDVAIREDLNRLVEAAQDNYGRLDVMINNAGISRLSRIDELDVEGWNAMIDVNIRGVLYGMAAAIPLFQKQNSGHIINIISTAGIKIVPVMGIYAATKNAVRTFTEAFRQESDGSIRITGISPGFVNTNLADSIDNEQIQHSIQNQMEEIAISPDDIANTVAFAISQPPEVETGDIVIRPSVQN